MIVSCNSIRDDYLTKIYSGQYDAVGVPTGYINSKGDTIIPIGKYYYCYSDTIRNFGIVMEKGGRIIGIDKTDNELFDIFKYDNGPDYVSDGLFRIMKNGKIGYADMNGKIIIKPQFDCAYPFKNGLAKVSKKCITEKKGEYSIWKSNDWFYINKKGRAIKK
ncbi:WG repeat-containing protein [bacterium]|nr:WG repeat-containing protein [bacterium]